VCVSSLPPPACVATKSVLCTIITVIIVIFIDVDAIATIIVVVVTVPGVAQSRSD
jgi:hypothetical protein